MIELALEHKLRPVIVSTPHSDALNRHFSDEFVDAMLYQNVKKANKRDVPYFDYRNHPISRSIMTGLLMGVTGLQKMEENILWNCFIRIYQNI